MKQFKIFIACFGMVLMLTQCTNEQKEKLVGIWRVTDVNLNETVMDVTSFGSWMWEFNEEGGYMINMAGAVEKGTYEITENKLTLKSKTMAEKPETVYDITKLDEKEMELTSVADLKNKSIIHLIKTNEGAREED
ncbi:MAG: lipocalin family protein [Bacteroidetes bacterium]|nr:lipocalin family protein [Bacteroidota bacterium]